LLILGGGIFLLSLWLGLEAVLRVTAQKERTE